MSWQTATLRDTAQAIRSSWSGLRVRHRPDPDSKKRLQGLPGQLMGRRRTARRNSWGERRRPEQAKAETASPPTKKRMKYSVMPRSPSLRCSHRKEEEIERTKTNPNVFAHRAAKLVPLGPLTWPT